MRKWIVLSTFFAFILVFLHCFEAACQDSPMKQREKNKWDWTIHDDFGPVFLVQRLARRGFLDDALELCNNELLKNPKNRYLRLERAAVYKKMGKLEKTREDLEYLIKHYDFRPAHYDLAYSFPEESQEQVRREKAQKTSGLLGLDQVSEKSASWLLPVLVVIIVLAGLVVFLLLRRKGSKQ